MNNLALVLAVAMADGRAEVKDIRFSINSTDGCLYVDYPDAWVNGNDNNEQQNSENE